MIIRIENTVGFLGLCLFWVYSSVIASDWEVTQAATISVVTSGLTQEDSTSANQAVNGLVLDNTNDTAIDSIQTVSFGSNDFALTQTGASTNSSVQAVNITSSESIDNLSQQVSGFATATLTQDMTAGTANVQSINYAEATTNIADLSQTVIGTTLVMGNSLAGNTQAVNYTQAMTYTGTLEQTATLTSANITNLGGTDVRINSVQGDITGLGGPIVQTTTIGTVTLNGASTLILNHVAP